MNNKCEILSRSNLAVRSNDPDTDFGYVCTVTLTFGDMSLGQGHDTPLGHGEQLCEISRSNMAVRSCGQDTDFGYVCTVTLTLGNNCFIYYPDPTWQLGVMARHEF